MTKKVKTYPYGYDNPKTAEEIILEVEKVINDIGNTLTECDGDMWMSDYRRLMDVYWRLAKTREQIKAEQKCAA